MGLLSNAEVNYISNALDGLIEYGKPVKEMINDLLVKQPDGWEDTLEKMFDQQEKLLVDLINNDYHFYMPPQYTMPSINAYDNRMELASYVSVEPRRISLELFINYAIGEITYNGAQQEVRYDNSLVSQQSLDERMSAENAEYEEIERARRNMPF